MSPAKSQAQQKAAGMALAAKRGEIPKSKLRGAAKEMMGMSESELSKMASGPMMKKPMHVKPKSKPKKKRKT